MTDADKPLIDVKRVNLGIHEVCKAMDRLDLTLLERWKVVSSVEVAARGMLGEKFQEFVDNHPELKQAK